MKYSLMACLLGLAVWLPGLSAVGASEPDYADCGLTVKTDQMRKGPRLETWKKQIQDYSHRHYSRKGQNENTWVFEPTAIVLHYTVSTGFPWNLVNTDSFANETPGLSVHFVVDKQNIWQLLPLNVRSRGAYGINHRGISIEMVALDAKDLAKRSATLESGAKLTNCLMRHFDIPLAKVYSHEQVSQMNLPETWDNLYPQPYHKIDPGAQNMQTIFKLMQAAP